MTISTSAIKESPPAKTKIDKVQGFMSLASTTVGVVGALGAAFVWLAMNVAVGDLEIKPDKAVEAIVIKVTDKRGQQSTYYGSHVQLMPGNYHLEIGVPDKPLKHVDTNVQLWKSNVISLAIPDELADKTADTPVTNQKRWWQFWKHNPAANRPTTK